MRRPLHLLLGAVLALAAAACGGGGDGGDGQGGSAISDRASATDLAIAAANFELVAGQEQRFIAGVQSPDDAKLAAFGTVELSFSYLGTASDPVADPEATVEATGRFLPVAGQQVDPDQPGPRLVSPSEALGVYGAAVEFPDAGFWQVDVTAEVDGRERSGTARFQVHDQHRLPAPGDPAPRTEHPVAGDGGVAPHAIDSRARNGMPLPDPELHATTIAEAIAAGRPLLVVISTPVYCQSRFCGPITDAVAAMEERYGDRLAFVHLEVWEDFEAGKVNPWVREWVVPSGEMAGGNEPWVYLVGADGRIVQRFDNVVSDAELAQAIEAMVGSGG